MATVEVSHKAAGVCSSSKTTDIYVASLPGLPTSLLPVYTHGTFETKSASLGHLSKSGKRLSLFTDSQLQAAARLAHFMLVVRSNLARIKAIFISGTSL